jgi:hypothetical protein
MQHTCLVEEAEHFATGVLSSGLLVVDDASAGSQHNVAELTGWQQVVDPLFNIVNLEIEARGDNTALVDAADQVDNDLARSVIIDNLKLANVTCRIDGE